MNDERTTDEQQITNTRQTANKQKITKKYMEFMFFFKQLDDEPTLNKQ